MKKAQPIEERVEQTGCDCCSTIPISYLALDLHAPFGGWEALFASRGVEVVTDDLGRPAIPRAALGELIAEREATKAAQRAESERQRKQAAQKKRVVVGVPAQEGMSAYESMVAATGLVTPEDEWGRAKPRFLEEHIEAGAKDLARRRAETAEKKRKKGLQ